MLPRAGVHDRLLAHLAHAGERSRHLGPVYHSCVMPCPLAAMVRSLEADELAALRSIVNDSARAAAHEVYRHQGLGAPDHPLRRLLEDFTSVALMVDGTDRAKGIIESRVRSTDSEAFSLLVAAVAPAT